VTRPEDLFLQTERQARPGSGALAIASTGLVSRYERRTSSNRLDCGGLMPVRRIDPLP